MSQQEKKNLLQNLNSTILFKSASGQIAPLCRREINRKWPISVLIYSSRLNNSVIYIFNLITPTDVRNNWKCRYDLAKADYIKFNVAKLVY